MKKRSKHDYVKDLVDDGTLLTTSSLKNIPIGDRVIFIGMSEMIFRAINFDIYNECFSLGGTCNEEKEVVLTVGCCSFLENRTADTACVFLPMNDEWRADIDAQNYLACRGTHVIINGKVTDIQEMKDGETCVFIGDVTEMRDSKLL